MISVISRCGPHSVSRILRPLFGLRRSIYVRPATTQNLDLKVPMKTFYDKPRKTKPKSIQSLIKKLNKKTRRDTTDETSKENILNKEIEECLQLFNQRMNINIGFDDIQNSDELIEPFLFTRSRPKTTLNNVQIIYHTSEAEGLAVVPKMAYAQAFTTEDLANKYSVLKVPKTIVGDIVTVDLLMHNNTYVECSLLNVENSASRSTRRKNQLVLCNKFDECSGCQIQMLRYDDQLSLKQQTIQKAYRFFYSDVFADLDESMVGQMVPSPKEYSYRTKITPHYTWKKNMQTEDVMIGFNAVDPTKREVDIDYCPIATTAVNAELGNLRGQIKRNLGAKAPKRSQSTAVIRESIRIDFKTGEYDVVALKDPNQIVTTKVDDCVFQFPATEFFQNNDSILPQVLDFIKHHLYISRRPHKNIIDTYCGSGFFGISLATDGLNEQGKVFGVELSKGSLDYAAHNAKINGLQIPDKIQFVHGSADTIFTNSAFRQAGLKGSESVVIMDPSRKGSNEEFLSQLLEFKPAMVVYVSCNVFTQARDIGSFMKFQGQNPIYKVKDIKGFDFFPQTKHVESVAILELV